jgi:hypothetical protein
VEIKKANLARLFGQNKDVGGELLQAIEQLRDADPLAQVVAVVQLVVQETFL